MNLFFAINFKIKCRQQRNTNIYKTTKSMLMLNNFFIPLNRSKIIEASTTFSSASYICFLYIFEMARCHIAKHLLNIVTLCFNDCFSKNHVICERTRNAPYLQRLNRILKVIDFRSLIGRSARVSTGSAMTDHVRNVEYLIDAINFHRFY